MEPHDERNLRAHWERLKQDMQVSDFLDHFLEAGLLSPCQRNDMLNTSAAAARAERFLQAVVAGGAPAYTLMCNILRGQADRQPRYRAIVADMAIPLNPNVVDSSVESRPTSRMSSRTSLSLPSRDGDVTEKDGRIPVSARAPWRSEPFHYADETADEPTKDEAKNNNDSCRPKTPAEAVHIAVAKAKIAAWESGDKNNCNVDMETLEKELVQIAPTIADLFNKISKQTNTVVATTQEELQTIKIDNDRLRKTNRALVEKLNSFQQKIIHLQLENKKLKDENDSEKIAFDDLKTKESALDYLKTRLEEQKIALQSKEKELDLQMQKIDSIVADNEEQKTKLASLTQLQEDGAREYEEQQEQLEDLMEEREKQREQILELEEKQRMGEHMLYRLEERLIMLERGGGTGAKRGRQRSQFGLSRSPWMNGIVDRSHHANVKVTPHFPSDLSNSKAGGKGWSF